MSPTSCLIDRSWTVQSCFWQRIHTPCYTWIKLDTWTRLRDDVGIPGGRQSCRSRARRDQLYQRSYHGRASRQQPVSTTLFAIVHHILSCVVKTNVSHIETKLIKIACVSITRIRRHAFLFDIVSNKRNSLDVDKYDYLQRDCYNVGIKSSIDCSRLMKMSRVIDDQICWHHKEVYNLYELYHTRFSLFKRVYTHRVGKAIEYMLTDALLAADSVMGISQAIFHGDQYLHLTDDIIRQIERSREPVRYFFIVILNLLRVDSMTYRTDIVLTLAVPSCPIGLGGLEGHLEEDPNTQPVQVCRRTFNPPRKARRFDKGILLHPNIAWSGFPILYTC